MEEVLDHLEEEGDGPLHLEGEGVAVKPDSDDEEALEGGLDEESKVGRNAYRALQLSYATEAVDQSRIFFETISEVQLSYITEAVTIDSS